MDIKLFEAIEWVCQFGLQYNKYNNKSSIYSKICKDNLAYPLNKGPLKPSYPFPSSVSFYNFRIVLYANMYVQELKEESNPRLNPDYGIPTPTLVSPPKVNQCMKYSNIDHSSTLFSMSVHNFKQINTYIIYIFE